MGRDRILPLAAMDKILRKAGADRVSKDAKKQLAAALEDMGEELSQDAIKFSQHAGRKTVTEEDVRLAAQKSS